MKLKMEEVDAIKISLIECASEDSCKALDNGNAICSRSTICKRTMNLIDTIEAQQQEIEYVQAHKIAMKEALSEAISDIVHGRLCSIGNYHNIYLAQISTSAIDKWIKILQSNDLCE